MRGFLNPTNHSLTILKFTNPLNVSFIVVSLFDYIAHRMLKVVCLLGLVLGASARGDWGPKEVYPGVGEYYYVRTPGNFTEAFRECVSANAHIATIDSDAEAAAMVEMMNTYQGTFIHTGFHDFFQTGSYITVTGLLIDDMCEAPGWAPGFPSNTPGDDCGGFTSTGVQNADCSTFRPYVCELNDVSGEILWPGYVNLPGFNYYKYVDAAATWTDADQACRDDGAHLLILNSQAEADAVDDQFFTGATLSAWVGLNRLFGDDATFVTIFGTPLALTGYSTWYGTSQPSGTYITAPYVYYSHTAVSRGLITFSNVVRSYICERER